jgi:hypothetical protein
MVIAGGACERAAVLAGRPYGGIVSLPGDLPGGCVWYSAGGSFYFNALPYRDMFNFGENPEFAQPVCAGALGSTKQWSTNICLWNVRLCVHAGVCLCRFPSVRVRVLECACARVCLRLWFDFCVCLRACALPI